MKNTFTIIAICISCSSLFAQQKQGQPRIDSLLVRLSRTNEDTDKIKLLLDLSKSYYNTSVEEGIRFGKEAKALAEKINSDTAAAKASQTIGLYYYHLNDYVNAMEYLSNAMRIFEEAGDKKSAAMICIWTGSMFQDQADYPQALDYFLKALRMNEQVMDLKGTITATNCIGSVYSVQGDYTKAISYYSHSLAMDDITDRDGTVSTLLNLGGAYKDQSDQFRKQNDTTAASSGYLKAKENYFSALKLQNEIGNNNYGIAVCLSSIACLFQSQCYLFELTGDRNSATDKCNKALEYFFQSLALFKEEGNKLGIENCYAYIGESYLFYARMCINHGDEKKSSDNSFSLLKKSKLYYDSAFVLQKEIGDMNIMKDSYKSMSEVNVLLGDYKSALENFKNFVSVKDSVFSIDSKKKIATLEAKRETELKEKEIQIQKLQLIKARNLRYGLIAGLGLTVILALVSFRSYRRKKRDNKIITKEKERSEELLLNILPYETAQELKEKGSSDAKMFDEVTVMFTDFKDFTKISEKLSPQELVAEIDTCFKAFDNIMSKFNIEKIKTIGDAYMAAGGLPVANKTHADDIVNAALEIQRFMVEYAAQKKKEDKEVFEIRIGIHTGPVVAGIVGIKKFAYDIWGDTVNIASRMESSGEAGKVNISGSTFEIVKNNFTCIHRGKIMAKNKGEIDMYFVEGMV